MIKRFIPLFILFLFASEARAQYGYLPFYTTASLPTCDATHVNRVVIDTDLDCVVVCDGAAWNCPSGSGAPTNAEYVTTQDNASLSADVFPSADDQIPSSDSSTSGSWKTLPSGAITYDPTGNAFSQATIANLAASTSANLRGVLSDEVGTGPAMFGLISTMTDDLSCTGDQAVKRNSADNAFECAVSPVAGGGTGLTSGTSGGILGFTAAGTIASSVALTANLPVIGGGAGATPTVGTRSGNTTAFVTTTGAQTSGDCVEIDANGNHIAAGAACGSGSGAPADAEYVVAALHAGLSAERLGTDTDTVDWDFGTAGQAKLHALTVPRPNTRSIIRCTIGAHDNSINAWACLGSKPYVEASGGSFALVTATATDPIYFRATTGGTTGNIGIILGAQGDSGPAGHFGHTLRFQSRVKMGQSTDQRVFVGLSGTYNSSASDDPAENIAAFRWSTGASDTNWKCVTNDGSGGGTINDSGVAVGTAGVEFEIVWTPATSAVFYINGTSVCTNTTNLPTGTAWMIANTTTLANAAKTQDVGWHYLESSY